ncbi:MAG: M1 family metallopeptidase [Candidatus Heimdallarchaeota archaeon]
MKRILRNSLKRKRKYLTILTCISYYLFLIAFPGSLAGGLISINPSSNTSEISSDLIYAKTSDSLFDPRSPDVKTPEHYLMNQEFLDERVINSNITVTVKLDDLNSVLEGNISIDYYNQDPINFDRIPFHLYPSGMTYVSRKGRIDILSVTDKSGMNLLFDLLSDQQLMWINLTGDLPPSMSTRINIKFNTTIPDGYDRSNSNGFDSNQSRIFTVTGFYPIPCVYDDIDGWNTDPYINVSDPFYFDMANYELTVIVPTGFVVAATGDLIDRKAQGNYISYEFKPNAPVREVVFSASRYFIMESTISGGINVSSFFLPHNNGLWSNKTLDASIRALTLFSDKFGTYPYTTYNIVETYGLYSGMEYPCQVQISEGIAARHPDDADVWFERTLAHEAAHQWWSQIVGNDQIDFGHLDEGLASWSTDYYFDYYNPGWNYFEDYWAINDVRTYYINNKQPGRVNQSAYAFIGTNMSFGFTAYTKASLLFQKLRSTLGNSDYISGLKNFYDTYKFKIATLPQLRQSFEEVTGKNLDWFFLPWFDNPYLPNYYVSNVTYNPTQNNMSFTVIDSNEDLNNYYYSQKLPIVVLDIRSFGILYGDQIWVNGTTEVEVNLIEGIVPGEIRLLYDSEVLAQMGSTETPFVSYSDPSWFNDLERPDSRWFSFEEDDWIEWNYRATFIDMKNQIPSLDQSGIFYCNILQMKRFTRTVEIESEWIWTPYHELFSEFTGIFTSYLDAESHVTPYHMALVSFFVGSEFQFTPSWLDSIRPLVDALDYEIQNEGHGLNVRYLAGDDNFTILADYNSDGILANLEIAFHPLYPGGIMGPELHGKLSLYLRNSSFKDYRPVLASLVELALIPFSAAVVIAHVAWYLRKRRNHYSDRQR